MKISTLAGLIATRCAPTSGRIPRAPDDAIVRAAGRAPRPSGERPSYEAEAVSPVGLGRRRACPFRSNPVASSDRGGLMVWTTSELRLVAVNVGH
jgi:hypothetical protein